MTTVDIARKNLRDGDLLTITPRVRFALWVTEVVPEQTRHWSVCPDNTIDKLACTKLTVTQHGPHSYTLTVYARTEDAAYEEVMAAVQRQEERYGVADVPAKAPGAGED